MNPEHAPALSDLPPPSAELVATRMLLEAYLRSVKPKARLRFQKALADVMQETQEAPTPLRLAGNHGAIVRAQRQAEAWLGRLMLVLMGR